MEWEALWEHTSESLAKAIPENPPQEQRDKLREDLRELLGRLAQRLPTANRLRLADPLGHEENEASRYNNAFEDAGGKESVENIGNGVIKQLESLSAGIHKNRHSRKSTKSW